MFQILREEICGKFHCKANLLSSLPKIVELSHEWVLIHFKYQEPKFYSRLVHNSEEGSFEVSPGCMKVGVIIKPLTDFPKCRVIKERKSVCVFCSLSSVFFFIGDKVAADILKDEIIPLINAKDRLKFSQDVALNNFIVKGKPQFKLSYILFEEKDVYDTLIFISPFPTLSHFADSICGIQYCVIVVGECIFDRTVLCCASSP